MVRKSGERLKRSIFFIGLSLYVFFLVDGSTMLFFSIAGMHVYFGFGVLFAGALAKKYPPRSRMSVN